VANRALEDVRRRILGIRAFTEPVGAVGVDALDERFGVGEGVSPQKRFASRNPPPFSPVRDLGADSGTRAEDTNSSFELDRAGHPPCD